MKYEATTHNLHFHENASIFSIDSDNSHIFTAGSDRKIRAWHIYEEEYVEKENQTLLIRDALNTSIKIKFCCQFDNHIGSVNSVRYNKFNKDYKLLATASDDGNVIVWEFKSNFETQNNDNESSKCKVNNLGIACKGNKCIDICWIGETTLAAGYDTGNFVLINFSIENNPDSSIKRIISKVLHNIKPHNTFIDGICFNKKYNIISTISRDKTCKFFLVTNKFKQISKIENFGNSGKFCDENEIIIFRRGTYSRCGKFLYLGSCIDNKKYCVYVLHYPFKENSLLKKIGDFDSPVLKILCNEENDSILFLTKNNIYMTDTKLAISNFSILPMTDACYYKNIIFCSAVDGFLYSLKNREK